MRKRYDSRKRRLDKLEGKHGKVTFRLSFSDGSTRGVEVDDTDNDGVSMHARIFTHVCDKLHCYPPKPPEGIVLPPPEPEPSTPSDNMIDLMAGAESIQGSRFFQTIFGMCKLIGERRKEKRNEGTIPTTSTPAEKVTH